MPGVRNHRLSVTRCVADLIHQPMALFCTSVRYSTSVLDLQGVEPGKSCLFSLEDTIVQRANVPFLLLRERKETNQMRDGMRRMCSRRLHGKDGSFPLLASAMIDRAERFSREIDRERCR